MTRPLHIGIDAHSIGARQGGNETYIRNLIIGLSRLDRDNLYTIYLASRQAAAEWSARFADEAPNFAVRILPPPTPIVRAPVALAFELRRRPVDLLHVQYTAPPFCPVPVVATIHDLAFEHYPETFTRRGSWQLRLTVRRTARRAARILTVSEFSRQDLLNTYDLPGEKVVVTWNGIEPRFNPINSLSSLNSLNWGPNLAQETHSSPGSPEGELETENESTRIGAKYGLRGGYLLALGSLQPRKNLPRLIRAYAGLRRHRPELNPQLVIAGRELWLTNEIFRELDAEIGDAPWRSDIVFTGYVPDADLPALYRGASVLVYPSIFEGFGLPPVEAMACGTPVVTSQAGSLGEICGAAARYIDPFDVDSIERGIFDLLTDKAERMRLIGAGIERARQFDWNETAEKTLAVYLAVQGEAGSSARIGRRIQI
jgi:glycosyltransferase involved in cell wall biosynthesis